MGKILPVVVAEGALLVAKIGATVAAATGVTVLKIGFCRQKEKPSKFISNRKKVCGIMFQQEHKLPLQGILIFGGFWHQKV